MSEAALAAHAIEFPAGLPPWTEPFAKAVDQIAKLEKKDAERRKLLERSLAKEVALDSSLDVEERLNGREEERRAEQELVKESEGHLRDVSTLLFMAC
jgi:hypothetical protein